MKNVLWIGLMPPGNGATYLRKHFTLEQIPNKVKCRISGLGFYELYLNGRRVGDGRLDPLFTRYDVRCCFRELEVTEYLVPGENICEIHLGRGWYAGDYTDVYSSHRASYRHICKAAMRMFAGKNTILETSEEWEAASGPVLSDSPRTGETFDARLLANLKWVPASRLMPPGGKLCCQISEPVTVQAALDHVAIMDEADQVCCYDFGQNLTGTVKLEVQGSAGSQVILRYGELYDSEKGFSQDNINWYVDKEHFQTDCYILCGDRKECWTPSFSYHGFRYVQVTVKGDAKVISLQALPMRSNFARSGSISCSDYDLSRLLEVAERSLTTNFVGFPSDCPHREKNGWLADAHLAADSMLVWYDAALHYGDFIDMIFDYQRPSGQLPGMVPGSGYGWHWDFGPVWSVAPIFLAYKCYMVKGDLSPVKKHYRKMVKYLEFCWNLRRDGLVDVGPAEWKCHGDSSLLSNRIIDSSLIECCLKYMSLFAGLLNKLPDQQRFDRMAAELAEKLEQMEPKHVSDLAVWLYFGHGTSADASRLDAMVRNIEYRAECGITGAKYIPRALAENGYIDTAYRMFTQHEFPGWQWMIDHGATTLWENWVGNESQNHPMMGDVAAWSVRYLAGIRILEPQYSKFVYEPQIPAELDSYSWEFQTPNGILSSSWQKLPGGKVQLNLTVPEKSTAIFGSQTLQPGEHSWITVINGN